MSRLRKQELPSLLTQRQDGESYVEYKLRCDAAYIVRDNQRNLNDYPDNPDMIASLRRYIGRSGYPPLP